MSNSTTKLGMTTVLDARVVAGSGGGPDKTIINSPRYLQSAGYKMLCAYMHSPSDAAFEQLREKARGKDVDLLSIADRGATDWRVFPQMLRMCKEHQVDIYHGHDYKTNVLGVVLKRFYRMKLVTTLHGWVHQTAKTPLYYQLDKLSLRHYDIVYCVSEDLYKAARAAGVPAKQCELLENGIDLEDYRRRQTIREAKESLGFAANRLLIGACGRLSKEKGFEDLIRAFGHLCGRYPFIDLVIIGEGDQKDHLEQCIRDWDLTDRVRLLGYRGDTPQIYQALDIFALSSYREGLPNVVLEAMATEVPVVATAVNGVPKLVHEEVSGLLVRPGRVEDMSEALARLIDDPAMRTRFSKAGREIVERDYSFARRMDKLRRSYDRLLQRG